MKIILLLTLLISQISFAGLKCGTKEGMLNQLASTFIIPDQFPPETPVLRDLFEDSGLYESCHDVVDLGAACSEHDRCYEQQLGKSRCDDRLQDQWVKTCKKVYPFSLHPCQYYCTWVVKTLSEAQRFDENGFCPSCDAYEAAGS